MDDDIFFGVESERRPPLSLSELRIAQAICDECPVARDCLTHALTQPELYGIWAGTSGNMREKMLRQVNSGISVTVLVEKFLEEG